MPLTRREGMKYSISEASICLYYQPTEHMLPHLILWSFSSTSLVQNGFSSSFEANFNPVANIPCRPTTTSLLRKKTSDLEVKIILSLMLLFWETDNIWADRFSSPVLCWAHKYPNLPNHDLCSVKKNNYKIYRVRFSLSIYSTFDHDTVTFLFISLQAWIYFNRFSFSNETVASVWSYID